jgi:shikimate dehydrogenase
MPPKTYSLGLIGYPLGHSLSPQIHGAALHALGMSGEYSLYPVAPHPSRAIEGGRLTLEGLLEQMNTGEIQGLNVTIPHKQNVIPLLDELTPAAETIGAVNTIFVQENKLIGDNTDAHGFWGDLKRLAVSDQQSSSSALVLGAGGSARAVIYALLTHGYHVTITARRIEQAQKLCNQLSVISAQLSMVDSVHRSLHTDHYSLLVNTTPVGMHPHGNESPWPADIPLPKHAAVYDLVYNPRETLLVRHARENGLPATTGLGMLVEQAALAFERWTGQEAPRNVMRQATGE